MTVHLRDIKTDERMPENFRDNYRKDGYQGAACGYMRRNVTNHAVLVTCKSCIKALKASQ